MPRENSEANFDAIGGIVNGLAGFVILTLMGLGYGWAIGSFAGVV